MRRSEILQSLTELLAESLEWSDPVRTDMRLREDLQLDSFRLLTLAVAVEDHFRICLDEDDEASIETVADLIDVVASKLRAAGRAAG